MVLSQDILAGGINALCAVTTTTTTTCWLILEMHLQVSPQKKLNPFCPLSHLSESVRKVPIPLFTSRTKPVSRPQQGCVLKGQASVTYLTLQGSVKIPPSLGWLSSQETELFQEVLQSSSECPSFP